LLGIKDAGGNTDEQQQYDNRDQDKAGQSFGLSVLEAIGKDKTIKNELIVR
jgi:hypothetical protein